MSRLKTSAMTGPANAYDHNTNFAIDTAMQINEGIAGVNAGGLKNLKVQDIQWKKLGLNPETHGAEVERLAQELIGGLERFEPSSYGVKNTYSQNTENTNRILDNIQAASMDDAEKQILSVVTLTKDFSRGVTTPPGFFKRMFKKTTDLARDVRENYESVSQRIESIMSDLETVKKQLNSSSQSVRELEEINKRDYHATSLYIAAGYTALNQLIQESNAIDENGTSVVGHSIKHIRKLNGLEKRLHDLELTQISRIQQSPTFELILGNNEMILEKLDSVTSTLIPAWRNGITTSLAIKNTQKATSMINAIADATNEYMLENSRMVRQSTADVARLSQRGIYDVNVLKEIQTNLEATVSDILSIQREGAVKRDAEMREIRDLQNNINRLAHVEIANTIERVTTPNNESIISVERRVEEASN